jgi:hypothetical protein
MGFGSALSIYDDLRDIFLHLDDRNVSQNGQVFSALPMALPLDHKDFKDPVERGDLPPPPTADPAVRLAFSHRRNARKRLHDLTDRKIELNRQGDIAHTGTKISTTWDSIVRTAEPNAPPPPDDPALVAMIKKAREYTDAHHDIYDEYKRRYQRAQMAYTTAYVEAMRSPLTAEMWATDGLFYTDEIRRAFRDWRASGVREKYEEQLAIQGAMGSDLFSFMKDKAAQALQSERIDLGAAGPSPYTYTIPGDFTNPDNDQGWITYRHYEDSARTSFSSEATSWSANLGISLGFWHIDLQANGSDKKVHDEFESSDLTVEMTIGTVDIYRPWLETGLLNTSGWRVKNHAPRVISNGNLNQPRPATDEALWLPSLPMQMVVAKNIRISTSKASSIHDFASSHIAGGARVGWFIFSIGGANYQRDTYQSSSSYHLEGDTIVIPGAQLIGWMQEITPAAPV